MKIQLLFLVASSSVLILTSCPSLEPISDPVGGRTDVVDIVTRPIRASLIATEKAQIAKDTKKVNEAIAALEKEGTTFKQIDGLASADLSEGGNLYAVAYSDLSKLRTSLVADVRNSGAKTYSAATKTATSEFQKSTNDFRLFAKSKNVKERSLLGFLTVSMGVFNKLTDLYFSFQEEKREAMVTEIEARLAMKTFDQL